MVYRYIKFLGVFIDDRLTWKDHISNVKNDIEIDRLLYECQRHSNNESLISLYHTLVHPYFSYCLHHDDVIKWKHFSRYWPFVRGDRWPVNSPHECHRRGAVMLSLICAWTNGWVNNGDVGDLRRHRAHYALTVMMFRKSHVLATRSHYWLNEKSRSYNNIFPSICS